MKEDILFQAMGNAITDEQLLAFEQGKKVNHSWVRWVAMVSLVISLSAVTLPLWQSVPPEAGSVGGADSGDDTGKGDGGWDITEGLDCSGCTIPTKDNVTSGFVPWMEGDELLHRSVGFFLYGNEYELVEHDALVAAGFSSMDFPEKTDELLGEIQYGHYQVGRRSEGQPYEEDFGLYDENEDYIQGNYDPSKGMTFSNNHNLEGAKIYSTHYNDGAKYLLLGELNGEYALFMGNAWKETDIPTPFAAQFSLWAMESGEDIKPLNFLTTDLTTRNLSSFPVAP